MYVATVSKVLRQRITVLSEHGADMREDEKMWGIGLKRLQGLFPDGAAIDYYLYTQWQTPMRVGLVKDQAFAYYADRASAVRTFGPPAALAVSEEILHTRLATLDEIIIRVSAFYAGVCDEKKTP